MPHWAWKDGRLSWSVVAAIVFATLSLLALDLVWRMVNIQFETLLVYALIADVAAAVALVLVARRLIRARRRARQT